MFRLFIYSGLIILYIIATLWPNDFILQLVGVVANLAVITSIYHARGLYLYSGILFYLAGIILFLTNDLSWSVFFLQFDTMIGMLALFIMLPFLNSLILVGRYDKQLSSLLEYKVENAGDIYKRGGLVTHILGLFLNIATIPLVLKSLHPALKKHPKIVTDKFYTQNLLRAYALCLMWSPMEIMVIKSLEITGKDYLFVFPFLILLAGFMFFMDMTFGKKKYTSLPIQTQKESISIKPILKKIRELFVLLLLLVIVVTILNRLIDQGYLFSLVLLIIPVSFLWAGKIRRVKRYISHTIPHWQMKTKGLANFFFMFISAGFFVSMIAETNIINALQNLFIQLTDQVIITYILIGLYFFITSFIGFHPLVSITLLAEILRPVLPEISSISLAIVLITSSLSTIMYSPFNVSLSILSSEIKRNSFQISVWNILFSLVLMGVSIVFAYIIHIATVFWF